MINSKEIELTLTGLSPLLMHAPVLANPLSPITIKHKKLTEKRNKTEEDYHAIAKSEYMSSLYWDEEIGVYVPTVSIKYSIWAGAKLNKNGKKVQRGVLLLEDKSKLIYDGPSSPADLWLDERFVDARSVSVGASRIMRYRPTFKNWELSVMITYDDEMIDEHELVYSADCAGRYIGIGDYRPDKGGNCGRFTVKY